MILQPTVSCLTPFNRILPNKNESTSKLVQINRNNSNIDKTDSTLSNLPFSTNNQNNSNTFINSLNKNVDTKINKGNYYYIYI